MGGHATFSGTTYQARLIAFVYVHMLRQSALQWLYPTPDTPVGVSGETGGPGDDIRIEFGTPGGSIEVQAKHGLTAGAVLVDVVRRIKDGVPGSGIDRVVLAVNRASSTVVYGAFARDLDRLRTGRSDGMSPPTKRVLSEVPDVEPTLRGLWVRCVDLDAPADPEARMAISLLEEALEDPSQAQAAWGVLVTDAGELCARRLRRTRKDLAAILLSAGIRLRPPRTDEKWLGRLEAAKRLVDKRHNAAALKELSDIEKELGGLSVSPEVGYRLHQLRGAALFQLDRFVEARSSALRALDYDVAGIHALQTASLASMILGDLGDALDYAQRGIAVDELNPVGWIALVQVEATEDRDPTPPPASVADAPGYRAALLQIAVNRADWDGALQQSSAMLGDGLRAPEVLLLRLQALMGLSRNEPTKPRLEEMERLSTEVLHILGDEHHPWSPKALVLRATARRGLNRAAEAQEDLERASESSPEDPELLAQLAQAREDAGDRAGALEALNHPVASNNPMLLLIRAGLQARDGLARDGRRDLEGALRLLPEAPDLDEARLGATEVAILLEDLELAKRLLNEIGEGGRKRPWYFVQAARIAFADGDTSAGVENMETAAQLDAGLAVDLAIEMAFQLASAGRHADAVTILEGIDASERPPRSFSLLVASLIELRRLEAAMNAIDQFESLTEARPEWVLRALTHIARLRDDQKGALAHLSELEQSAADDVGVRFELARQLIGLDRKPEAIPHVEALRAAADLTPRQTMLLAQLLNALEPSEDAIRLAFSALRREPTNPELHKAFISLCLISGVQPSVVDEVTPDSHVKLTGRGGDVRAYTIFAEGPVDPLRGEIAVAEAEELGLIGLTVGATWRRHEGEWREEEWTVTEILSASHFGAQDAMLHFEERFPNEPFFITRMAVVDGSPGDFAPIIASATKGRDHAKSVMVSYQANVFPLGVMANALGVSEIDFLETFGRVDDPDGPVFVEWSNRAGMEESIRTARQTDQFVVTSTALASFVALGHLKTLAKQYDLIAANSLEVELRALLIEAEKAAAEGKTSLGVTDTGVLRLEEMPAGHKNLVALVERRRSLVEALSAVELKPRPLDAVDLPGSQEEQLSAIVGVGSMDAVRLAESEGSPLLADDLGLRRLAGSLGVPSTASSIAVLLAWAEKGVIDPGERDDALLALLRTGYAFVPPSVSLLERSLRTDRSLHRADRALTFGLLSSPLVDLDSAGRLVALLLRKQLTAAVQLEAVDTIVSLAMAAMKQRWPAAACAQAIILRSTEVLSLFPSAIQEIRDSAAAAREGEVGGD